MPTQQPSPQPTALATPTGDHGNSNDKPASLTESDSEVGAEVKREGEGQGQGGRRDDNSAKEEVAASPTVCADNGLACQGLLCTTDVLIQRVSQHAIGLGEW